MTCFHSAVISGAVLFASASASLSNCTIFQHRDFGGSGYTVGSHETLIMDEGESYGCSGHEACDYTTYEPSWDDELSSFQVGPGCVITLWEDDDRDGAYFQADTSYSYVGGAWNDEASAVNCVCDY
jgi:syncollin